ncbi:MAG: sulfatase-like hydrolase/transferase [Anaerolineae bacterium]|nr:sulfatase-like hydrolase/transferase [Anaerolineae bacterium]
MPTSKPNILLIVLDTLRRDHLSTYGHDRETSPQLDAFADGATVFERAVAAAQWTIPSHAAMFTGLQASTHGLTQADGALSGMHPTLAEILQGAGYRTAAFCNNPLVGVLNNGLQRGFQRFYNYASAAPFRPREAQRSKLQRQALQYFRRYFARPLGNQFAHSDFLFRMSLNPAFVPFWTRLINYKGNTANSIDDLIGYLGQQDGERPVFAFLNLMGAHLPYNPPQDYLNRVAPELKRDKQAYGFVRRFNADAARWATPPDPALEDWERSALDAFYDAEIAYQDEHLGRLLNYLKQSGALDNTLVMICADHGEGHGDHDFFGHGFVVYQELVHVPLILRWPERFPAGKRLMQTVSTRRIFHTALEAAGILKPPLDDADPNANVAGLTLAHIPAGSDLESGVALTEAFPPLTFLNVIQHRNPALIERLKLRNVRRGIYDGAHKLAMVDDRVEGLFNVADDPLEMRDLAATEAAWVAALSRRLSGLVTQAESRRVETAEFEGGTRDAAVLEHLRALGYIE